VYGAAVLGLVYEAIGANKYEGLGVPRQRYIMRVFSQSETYAACASCSLGKACLLLQPMIVVLRMMFRAAPGTTSRVSFRLELSHLP
jgi:hypothetical protein